MEKMKRHISKALIFILFAVSVLTLQFGTNPVKARNAVGRDKTEILIKYKDSSKSDVVKTSLKNNLKLPKLRLKKKFSRIRTELLEIDDTSNMDTVIKNLKKDPNVEYAQPNYKLTPCTIDDPNFGLQWALQNNGQEIQGRTGRSSADVNAVTAWGLTTGSNTVVVGLLDTGVNINHEDLKDNIYRNTRETAGNGMDDDGDGYIDDVNGWDFANNDNNVFDSESTDAHGTEMAGIIAAAANNKGIRGVAPNVKILPLKFINNGTGYTCDAIAAIDYAMKMGVKIINCSFGGSDNNYALKDAMANSGILFICAAGNRAGDVQNYPVYPACFNLPNIISVASINNRGVLDSTSGYGSKIQVAAPGVDILTTMPGNAYGYVSGTSASAAHVTGVAALIKSYLPNNTITNIADRIKNNVTVCTALQGKVSTNGRVDAYAALTNAPAAHDIYVPQPGEGGASQPGAGEYYQDMWYTMDQLSRIKEKLHYGESGVSTASGNYSFTVNDMSIAAPGFQVNISRTYNSKSEKSSPMGRGWTFGFEGSLSGTNTVSAILPNGSTQTFNLDTATNKYIAQDSRSSLVKNADGTFTLTTKDQYQYIFTNNWLTKMTDRNGNTVTIDVDSNGKVQKITDTAGRQYIITYNTVNGMIDNIKDPANRVVSYHYNGSNLLDKVTDPAGKTMNYRYDDYGYLTEVDDNDGNAVEKLAYNHDAGHTEGRVTQATDANNDTSTYAYDVDNRKTTVVENGARTYVYWFDPAFYTTQTQEPDGRFTYTVYYLTDGTNKYGDIKSTTDRNGNRTQYEIDARGNVTKTINPDLSFRTYQYDAKNNLIKETDEDGRSTCYIYDSNGINLLKKIQPLNGTDAYVDGTSDPAGYAITTYTYYAVGENGYTIKGLLKSATDPENYTTAYEYDINGDTTKTTDPEGNVTTNHYNSIGWMDYTITPNGNRTDYTYDPNGQLEKTTRNNGTEISRTTYDSMGRTTKEVSPNQYNPSLDDIANHTYSGDVGTRYTYTTGGLVSAVKDAENNRTTCSYDVYGNKTKEIKPNGAVYLYEYDELNRPVKEYFKENDTDPDTSKVLLEVYSYSITSDNRTQKTVTRYLNDIDKAVTVYIYDYANRLVEQQDPDGSKVKTTYNPSGTIATTTAKNGSITCYRYDGLGRLSEQWAPSVVSNGDTMYVYTKTEYDKVGNKTAVRTGREKVTLYGIPSSLAVTNCTYYRNGKVKTVTDSAGRKVEYRYDGDGNISVQDLYTSATSKNVTEFTYNHLDKPLTQKVHVMKGDIYGNDINDTTDTVLTTAYTYDKNGNLKTETKPDNITTTHTYDNMDRQTGTSQPGKDENGTDVSITTSTTFDFEGKPLTKTDENGNTTTYSYTRRGFLGKVTDPNPGVAAYYYDRAGRKIAEVSPKNYDPTKALADMNRSEYTYDTMGRVTTKTETYYDTNSSSWISFVSKAYRYELFGNLVKELDALGYEAGTGATISERIDSGYGIEYTYDLEGRQISTLDPVSQERSLPFTTRYDYDSFGRKTTETNARGVETVYTYDDAGNVLNVKLSGQTIQSATYDLTGRQLTKTDGNGNTTAYEYNALGKVRKTVTPGDISIPSNTITFQYDVNGNLMKSQDSLGTVDLYNYDNQDRELSHTEQKSDGTQAITTTTKYDRVGNKRFETDGNGGVTTNTYDAMNRLKTVTVSGKTTTYNYDANDDQTGMTDWRGNTTTSIYDPLNRLVEKRDALGKLIQKLEYNHNHVQIKSYSTFDGITMNATRYVYDRNNRLVSTIDPLGHTTSQDYDDAGNISTKIDGNGIITTYRYDNFNRLAAVVNAKSETTSYTYDLNGNMLAQTDDKGNRIIYEYNAANKPIRRIDAGGRIGAPGSYVYVDGKSESYTYYVDGKIKTKTDRNSNTTNYTYDIHDRLLSQAIGTSIISYTYDNNGNQSSMTDGTGTTTRTYDSFNRVLTKTVPHIGQSVYEYDITSGMDEGCRAEKSTDPKGNITTKVYDKVGRLWKVTAGGNTTTYAYYDNGSRKSVTYSGSKEEYTYYADGLCRTLINSKLDGTEIDSYSYAYDAARNQTGKTDKKGTTSYTYDCLNRLQGINEQFSGKVTTYTFDAAGNRISETVTQNGNTTSTVYTYNEQNRLMKTITTCGGVKETDTYSYDDNGNMVSKTKASTKPANPNTLGSFNMSKVGQGTGSDLVVYDYDIWNQLVKSVEGSNTLTYNYNGEGLRVQKTVNGTLTNYLYEYDKVVLETDNNNNQTARNVYGINLLARTVGSETYNYMYNGHADVTALVKPEGTVMGTYYYDAFGNITEQTGNVNNNVTYAGYQWDSETALYYLNARYYDSKIARFLSEDTYKGQIKDPLSLNLYTYCHNEPIMYADPSGHKDVWIKDIAKKNGATVDWDAKKGVAVVNMDGYGKVEVKGKIVNGKMYIDDNTFNNVFGINSKGKDTNNASGNNTGNNNSSSNSKNKVNISLDVKTGTIKYNDSKTSITMYLPSVLYDSTKDKKLSYSTQLNLSMATNNWFTAKTKDDKIKYLNKIEDSRQWAKDHPILEGICNISKVADGGILESTNLKLLRKENEKGNNIKGMYLIASVTYLAGNALDTGNLVHYDQENGGEGKWLPSEFQEMYPDANLKFTFRGEKGVDVEVLPGGTHPSLHSENPMNWPEGFDYGDFKPGTSSGLRTFYKDINSGKIPADSVFLPYDPETGKLMTDFFGKEIPKGPSIEFMY
jgi:RHS repeat-associated core domain